MISVIVPVYKIEKYLDICVQSILAQSYTDFELILVDDGSPDNCPQMCDAYSEKDRRVKVIHKINGGLSDARNVGISLAKGDWITFIDSDDYVSQNYLEELWKLKNKYNADISVTGICTFYDGDFPKKNISEKEYCYSGIEALENMLYQNTLDSSACAMLLPIKIAKNNLFPIGKFHEDEFSTYKYYASVAKVAVTLKSQYFYRQRKGSIMHTFGQASIDELDAADNYLNFAKENYPQLIPAATSKSFSDYCQVLLSNYDSLSCNSEIYKRVIDYLNISKKSIIFDRKCRLKNRIAAMLLCLSVKFFCFVGHLNLRIR